MFIENANTHIQKLFKIIDLIFIFIVLVIRAI